MTNKQEFSKVYRTRTEFEHNFPGNLEAVDAEARQALIPELNKVAQQAILDMEHKFLFGNTSTCAAKEPEPLTVDALIKTMQKIRDLAPVVWYRFCEWLPDEINGEPCNAVGLKFGEDWVLFIHPDRFEIVKRSTRPCKLVEYPQERMEQQTALDALDAFAALSKMSFADAMERMTKRVMDEGVVNGL